MHFSSYSVHYFNDLSYFDLEVDYLILLEIVVLTSRIFFAFYLAEGATNPIVCVLSVF